MLDNEKYKILTNIYFIKCTRFWETFVSLIRNSPTRFLVNILLLLIMFNIGEVFIYYLVVVL